MYLPTFSIDSYFHHQWCKASLRPTRCVFCVVFVNRNPSNLNPWINSTDQFLSFGSSRMIKYTNVRSMPSTLQFCVQLPMMTFLFFKWVQQPHLKKIGYKENTYAENWISCSLLLFLLWTQHPADGVCR